MYKYLLFIRKSRITALFRLLYRIRRLLYDDTGDIGLNPLETLYFGTDLRGGCRSTISTARLVGKIASDHSSTVSSRRTYGSVTRLFPITYCESYVRYGTRSAWGYFILSKCNFILFIRNIINTKSRSGVHPDRSITAVQRGSPPALAVGGSASTPRNNPHAPSIPSA
jgi:hypothetical protein